LWESFTAAIWVLAMVTHPGARYAGPLWLASGLVVFVAVRRSGQRGLFEHVEPVEELPQTPDFRRILVPMKLGDIGEEMIATAIALAKEHDAEIEAITVVRVPREFELEGPFPPEVAARVDASLEEARMLGEDHGVEVNTSVVRARSIGHAIVERRVATGRCHRARLVPALEAAIPVLLADRRLRVAESSVRSARGAFPEGSSRSSLTRRERSRHRLRRVGSAVAKGLAADGWDVSVIDENEDALARLGGLARRVRCGTRDGHDRARERRCGRGRCRGGRDERRQYEHRDRPGVAEALRDRHRRRACLDPARAQFYADRGMRTVCPTQTAITVLLDTVRANAPQPSAAS
jgi:hypothetical protein